jgi:hypothetical protein
MQKFKIELGLKAAGRHATEAVLFLAIAAVSVWGSKETGWLGADVGGAT